MGRKIKIILLCSIFVSFGVGCNKNTEQDILPIAREEFTYTVSEDTCAIAVDEEGFLYTVKSDMPKAAVTISTYEEFQELAQAGKLDLLELDKEYSIHTVEVYDAEGNLIRQEDVEFGNGTVRMMIFAEGKLYCISSVELEHYVYEIDTSTWEVKQLALLPEYLLYDQMVLVDDYLYVLGKTGNSKEFTLYPGVRLLTNQGEQICRIPVTEKNPKAETMKVDYPIGIYATEQDTLMIYQYTEERGFGFLEFNSREMTLKEHEWTHVEYARNTLSGCGNGYVYRKNEMVFYGTPQGVQVQLLPEQIRLSQPVVCQKGFAFLLELNHGGKVKRICVAEMIKDNKELRVLTDDSPNDFPYGCGYQMTTRQAVPDEFALKVLAQDSDFDLFVLDTRNDCAANLKENGAFYALNKVDGVQEYLDACFPYMKELAYNEDGDIWMIPVDIDIPGIVYNREFCTGQGVDYSSMDYMEFMEFVEKTEATEPEKIYIHIGTMLEPMLMQYVSMHDSFDTELFRTHLSKLKQIYDDATTWGNTSVYGYSLGDGVPADFYLDFTYNSEQFENLAINETAKWAYAPSYFPKLTDGIGNVGTITLLAVNPESDNLKETLNYITEYCNYMLTVKNSFVLADKTTYDMDNAFVKDYYDMVAGGVIEFRMTDDVYTNTFWNYLEGGISLDDAITEADRKMKIYKGE